jgi:uncharacterized protein YggU (UPF0235/DUF167 family)
MVLAFFCSLVLKASGRFTLSVSSWPISNSRSGLALVSPIRRKTSHINVKLISVPAKGKAKKTIKEIFKKKVTKETKAKPERELEIGQEETDRVKRPEAFKTSEQKKANTIQQKRRLFNRKSGE